MSCLVSPFIFSPRSSSLLVSLPLFFLRFFSRLFLVSSPLVPPHLFVSLFNVRCPLYAIFVPTPYGRLCTLMEAFCPQWPHFTCRSMIGRTWWPALMIHNAPARMSMSADWMFFFFNRRQPYRLDRRCPLQVVRLRSTSACFSVRHISRQPLWASSHVDMCGFRNDGSEIWLSAVLPFH